MSGGGQGLVNRVAWSIPARLPVSAELPVTPSNVLLNKAEQKKSSEVNPSTRRQQEAASGPTSSPPVHLSHTDHCLMGKMPIMSHSLMGVQGQWEVCSSVA